MNCSVLRIYCKNERQTHHILNVRCQTACHDWARFGKLIWDWSWQELNDTELWWLEQQFRSLEFCHHPSPRLQGTRRSWLSILEIYNARYWVWDILQSMEDVMKKIHQCAGLWLCVCYIFKGLFLLQKLL